MLDAVLGGQGSIKGFGWKQSSIQTQVKGTRTFSSRYVATWMFGAVLGGQGSIKGFGWKQSSIQTQVKGTRTFSLYRYGCISIAVGAYPPLCCYELTLREARGLEPLARAKTQM